MTVFEIDAAAVLEILPPEFHIIAGTSLLAIAATIFAANMRGKAKRLGQTLAPFLVLWAFILVFAFAPSNKTQIDNANELYALYQSGEYEIVEGVVKVLRVQPKSGHAPGDLISIGNKQFEIGYTKSGIAYSIPLSHGGHLKNGVLARIYHSGNSILKIEMVSDDKANKEINATQKDARLI